MCSLINPLISQKAFTITFIRLFSLMDPDTLCKLYTNAIDCITSMAIITPPQMPKQLSHATAYERTEYANRAYNSTTKTMLAIRT